MNTNPQRPTGVSQPAAPPHRRPDLTAWLAGIAGAAAVLSLLLYQVIVGLHKHEAQSPPESATAQEGSPADTAADSLQPVNPTLTEAGNSAPRRSAAKKLQTPKAGSLELAQQLIARLAQLDVSKRLTPEGARQVNEIFKQLIAQGPVGIPAIRAFLQRNEDLDFSKVEGGNLADYKSLRFGLIDALKQIGGPEALAVSLQTLQTTTDPREIAVLARDLEQQAPGEYRQQAVASATQSLSRALAGGTGGVDVGPLFQVLQSYGDAGSVPQLEKAFNQWTYYSAITLANLPGGEGIPALTRLAQDPTVQANGKSDIAVLLLAQVSAENSQASGALVQLARENQLSASEWNAIASGLAGYNLELGSPLGSGNPGGSGLSSLRVEDGGQNLFTTPLSASWLDGQISPRLDLIDQLVAANPNATTLESLQQARAFLSKMSVASTSVPH